MFRRNVSQHSSLPATLRETQCRYTIVTSIPMPFSISTQWSEMPLSVITCSTSSSPQIRPKPLLPNLLESASTIVFCEACIILRLSCASCICVVVNPKSGSIPSTPRKSLLQEKSSRIFSAYIPVPDEELLRRMPPNTSTSISA